MSLFDAIVQAILQGLTEFLPVSSSGHLSLYQHFTGNNGEGALMFSAVLHLGTLVAVFIAFRKDILELIKELGNICSDIFKWKFTLKNMNPQRRMIVMIILSCLCLAPFAFFKDWFESIGQDNSIFAEGLCFLYTGAILFMSDRCTKGNKKAGDIKVKDSITVGLFQGVALLPGVSRSGSTISAGLFSGFSRETSVKYSFILGIPVILLSCLLEVAEYLKKVMDSNVEVAKVGVGNCIVGFIVAAVVGVLAIKLVSWLVKSDKFKVFSYYTFVLGAVVLVIAFIEFCMGHPISFK
ncbi:MAG: undecaprenyl-diphosphate phosphatase [Ruminococcus sp.]|uniref:undecaprenyl-diphosphate phosphatase n=1 Tax=Ruminococcus sp. TaxID=41978 RepID=UPI0025F5C453|nr:undecaprenyl-diphosphate phosphatase [Ruminococcus sp.]MCR5539482.1 undecaprenyl-diphosphate phosphatase [Ruminococcus sp.]